MIPFSFAIREAPKSQTWEQKANATLKDVSLPGDQDCRCLGNAQMARMNCMLVNGARNYSKPEGAFAWQTKWRRGGEGPLQLCPGRRRLLADRRGQDPGRCWLASGPDAQIPGCAYGSVQLQPARAHNTSARTAQPSGEGSSFAQRNRMRMDREMAEGNRLEAVLVHFPRPSVPTLPPAPPGGVIRPAGRR